MRTYHNVSLSFLGWIMSYTCFVVSWNAAEKGPWEPPSIPNPDYFGKWQPRWIENPDYKGEWQQPMIPNPKFIEEDAEAYIRCLECSYVGFDLWQQVRYAHSTHIHPCINIPMYRCSYTYIHTYTSDCWYYIRWHHDLWFIWRCIGILESVQ